MKKALLDIFKVMLVKNGTPKVVNYKFMTKGIILNFNPSNSQVDAIESYIRDSNVQTLFSVSEVKELSTDEKIVKQFNHYALQYGTNYQFDVMRSNDQSNAVTVTLIRGVNKDELQDLINDSLYSNRPVKDSKVFAEIIKFYNLKYDINEIRNNELRVILFDVNKDKFTRGDDAVRYIVNNLTDSDLLIKSEKVIKDIEDNSNKITLKFLENHKQPLSEVYNRHKRILMAVKVGNSSRSIKSVINQIARMSKHNHIPLEMPLSKSFISDVMNDPNYNFRNLREFTLRDKFKLLNVLEFKTNQLDSDIFVIRNGRIHYEKDRPVYNRNDIDSVINELLNSIKKDLKHLKGKIILLPDNIDYGLPISRKQSVGNLPFGTKVSINEGKLSSGIYWKDEWGAYDIDLSSINQYGQRTGWGQRSGYNSQYDVEFSGDVIGAPDGAMEFLTSSVSEYGLFANIYNGKIGSKIQIVVGNQHKGRWIENAIIREELNLKSNGNLVGLVQGREFIVFYGRMNDNRVSDNSNSIMIQKALSMKWTVKKLFDYFGIKYYSESDSKVDYDLTYAGFTFDKLEVLFKV